MGPNEILDKSILVTGETPLFHVVMQTGLEQGEVVDTAGAGWLGVAQEPADELDVANGRHIRVRLEGISVCVADGEIDYDTVVYAAADGRVTATAAGANRVVGITRTASTAADDHITVQLTPGLVVAGD